MNGCECDTCCYYDYDEEYDEYFCMMDLDGRTTRYTVTSYLPEVAVLSTGRVMITPWQGGSNI